MTMTMTTTIVIIDTVHMLLESAIVVPSIWAPCLPSVDETSGVSWLGPTFSGQY